MTAVILAIWGAWTCAGSSSDSVDSSEMVQDEAPSRSWSVRAEGSANLESGARRGNSHSFVSRDLGSDPASSAQRGWIEERVGAGSRWGSLDEWRVQGFAAPLVGLERLDSAGVDRKRLLLLREGWVRLERSASARWSLRLGRFQVEPDPGLAAHPSRVLPFRTRPEGVPDEPEEDNPVGAELAWTPGEGRRTVVEFFPRIDPHNEWKAVADSQDPLVRLEQSWRFGREHEVRLEAGFGRFLSIGGSWEWSRDDWFLSCIGAVRDDRTGVVIGRDSAENWRAVTIGEGLRPEVSAAIQRDFPIPLVGRIRLSMEWSDADGGWSAAESRRVARRIDSMVSVPRATPEGGKAMSALGGFAGADLWTEGYAQRLLVRLGSVESLRWGGGIDLLMPGPFEGAIVHADAPAAVRAHLDIECVLTFPVWSRAGSIVSQLPESADASLGARWSF